MRGRLIPVFALVLLLTAGLRADELTPLFAHIYFGELPLGKGASAWGLGGTGIALGEDADAASWNPAALARVTRPAASFSVARDTLRLAPTTRNLVGSDLAGRQTTWGTVAQDGSGASGVPIERVAFAYPLHAGERTIVAQISYDRSVPFSLHSTYAYNFSQPGYGYAYRYEAPASGGIDSLSLSAAMDFAPGLSGGVTLHRWTGGYTIPVAERYDCAYTSGPAWTEQLRDDLRFDISGTSIDLGLQGAIANRRYFAGLRYRSGVAARVRYSNTATFTNTDPRQVENLSGAGRGDGTLKLPESVGAGFGMRPLKNLAAAFDYVGTYWADARFEQYARATPSGEMPVPTIYLFPTMKRPDVWAQRNTDRYSIGVEYTLRLASLTVPLRAGRYWEDLLAFDENGRAQKARGVTVGAGVAFHRAEVNIAWSRQRGPGPPSAFARDVLHTSLGYRF